VKCGLVDNSKPVRPSYMLLLKAVVNISDVSVTTSNRKISNILKDRWTDDYECVEVKYAIIHS